MTECPSRAEVAALLADSLMPQEEALLNVHLLNCDSCRRLLDELTGDVLPQALTSRNIFSGRALPEPDAEFDRFVDLFLGERSRAWLELDGPFATAAGTGAVGSNWMDNAKARSKQNLSWPEIAGFDLIAELGRGGNGVVYRALHRGLGRHVALKIIRARASNEELARFRQEAATLARLQHPNVVQIYEVGEVDGRPHFSMEYVAGGNLAQRIGDAPQDERTAARLVETLATAMQVVHQHGIVHRDLKPSNILLAKDEGGRMKDEKDANFDSDSTLDLHPSSVQLKITDFGLAKHLKEGAELTQTRDFLGSPSYMAPEQTRGGNGRIDATTDVYALGAILYKLLTGRPPFSSARPMDTLLQVAFDEPTSPRRLIPSISRDLETICLKCLNKDPTGRYGSAADLSQDLSRFLAGRPIKARPVGLIGHIWRWCTRNRLAAQFLVVVLVLLVLMAILGPLAIYRERTLRGQAEVSAREATANAEDAKEEKSRADQNLDLARKATQGALVKIAQNQRLRGAEFHTLREELLLLLLENATKLGHLQSQNPMLEADRGRTLLQVAYIQGELGKTKEGLAELGEAVGIFERLTAEYPENAFYQRYLAACKNDQGVQTKRQGDLAQAERCFTDSMNAWARLAAQAPGSIDYRQGWADALSNLGLLLTNQSRPSEAVPRLAMAVDLLEKICAESPAERRYLARLARTRTNLALSLDLLLRYDEAQNAFRLAEAAYQKLLAESPTSSDFGTGLAATYVNFGILKGHQGERSAALEYYAKTLQLLDPILAKEPRLSLGRRLKNLAHYQRADTLMELGRPKEAVPDWDAALQLTEPDSRPDVRVHRAVALATSGAMAAAIVEATQLTDLRPTNGDRLFECARIWALAMGSVAGDKSRHDEYARKLFAALALMARQEQLELTKTLSLLRTGSEFALVRDSSEFKQLIQDLESRTTSPAAPSTK